MYLQFDDSPSATPDTSLTTVSITENKTISSSALVSAVPAATVAATSGISAAVVPTNTIDADTANTPSTTKNSTTTGTEVACS